MYNKRPYFIGIAALIGLVAPASYAGYAAELRASELHRCACKYSENRLKTEIRIKTLVIDL